MARKNLLKDLIDKAGDPPAPPDDGAAEDHAARPRYAGGAIGAVSQSIAHLKSRAILDLDPDKVHGAGLEDRLDGESDADHAALVESIRAHGQQVPVLVRPHPDKADEFQIVYGRRRVLALRALGQPVKALVRDLDDRSLVIAQGQENTARKDLSFIEKAHFARQMRDQGYDRTVICAALHVDKTVVSRMLSVIDRLPDELVRVIGAAPSVGRNRWLDLADLMESTGTETQDAIAQVNLAAGGETSDRRFVALMSALEKRKPGGLRPASAPDQPLIGADGVTLGTVSRRKTGIALSLEPRQADGFDEWLVENIAEIHRSWQKRRGG